MYPHHNEVKIENQEFDCYLLIVFDSLSWYESGCLSNNLTAVVHAGNLGTMAQCPNVSFLLSKNGEARLNYLIWVESDSPQYGCFYLLCVTCWISDIVRGVEVLISSCNVIFFLISAPEDTSRMTASHWTVHGSQSIEVCSFLFSHFWIFPLWFWHLSQSLWTTFVHLGLFHFVIVWISV